MRRRSPVREIGTGCLSDRDRHRLPNRRCEGIALRQHRFPQPARDHHPKGRCGIGTAAEADAGTVGPLAITAALLRRAVLAVNTTINDLATTIGNALDGLAAFTVYGGGLVTGGAAMTPIAR